MKMSILSPNHTNHIIYVYSKNTSIFSDFSTTHKKFGKIHVLRIQKYAYCQSCNIAKEKTFQMFL